MGKSNHIVWIDFSPPLLNKKNSTHFTMLNVNDGVILVVVLQIYDALADNRIETPVVESQLNIIKTTFE